jgi:exodeoxyribonuclease X
MHLVFFDTETTGNGEHDRLCQLAIKSRGVDAPILNELYKPPLPIPVESMAIHHITERMVADKPAFVDASAYAPTKSLFENPDTVAVAHNAAFDISMLAREGITPARTICTYKVANALDPNDLIPNFKRSAITTLRFL